MRRRPRLVRWAVAVAVLAAAAAGVAVGVARSAGRERPASVAYTAAPVERGTVEKVLTGTGAWEAAAVDVWPEVEGTVAAVRVQPGDRVQAGQVLVELSNDDVVAAVRQARAGRDLVLADLAQMLGVPPSAAASAPAPAQVTVAAPAPGRLISQAVATGQNVTRGQILATLTDDRALAFEAEVSQAEVAQIQEGLPAQVIADGFEPEPVPGRVVRVDRRGRPGEQAVVYRATVLRPTSGTYLLSGEAVHGMDDDRLAAVRNRYIGFVFQHFNLLPRLTALQNVELPLMLAGVPPCQRRQRAQCALPGAGNLPTAPGAGHRRGSHPRRGRRAALGPAGRRCGALSGGSGSDHPGQRPAPPRPGGAAGAGDRPLPAGSRLPAWPG